MTDHSEHDDGAVTRSVLQFRRLARLAGADPLRLLPADPLTRLLSLGAPVAALIDLTPFERLRDAFATVATARTEAARARVQPLVPGSKVRPHAPRPLAERAPRRATQRDAGISRAAHDAAAAGDLRVREDRSRGNTPSIGTLAQRRRALRRGLPHRETPSSQPLVAVARTPAQAGNPANPPGLLKDDRVRRAGEYISDTAAAPTRPQPPLQTEPRVVAGEGPTIVGEALRAALTPGDVETTRFPGERTPVTFEAAADTAADTAFQAGSTIGAAPATAGGTGVSVPSLAAGAVPRVGSPWPARTDSTISPISAESARGRRPRNTHTGLEITDELFEALYRSGVDQSWP